MGFTVSLDLQNKLPQIAKWTLHAGWSGVVGYCAGYTINMCDRWLHPVKNALGKPPIVNPIHGVACGVAFALVDRAAKYIMDQNLPDHISRNQITHAARKFVTIGVTSLLASALSTISFTMAAVLITTNVLATVLLGSISKNYDSLMYKKEASQMLNPDAPGNGESFRQRRQPVPIKV